LHFFDKHHVCIFVTRHKNPIIYLKRCTKMKFNLAEKLAVPDTTMCNNVLRVHNIIRGQQWSSKPYSIRSKKRKQLDWAFKQRECIPIIIIIIINCDRERHQLFTNEWIKLRDRKNNRSCNDVAAIYTVIMIRYDI
jgi:hypothetical protein